jgi:hypothetical protein
MTPETYSELAGAIGALAGAAVAGFGFARFMLTRADTRRQLEQRKRDEHLRQLAEEAAQRWRTALEGTTHIYNLLGDIVANTEADRAVVVAVHNGGRVPAAGRQLYATVTHEARDGDLPSLRGRWQRVQIDEWYVRLCTDLHIGAHRELPVARYLAGDRSMRPSAPMEELLSLWRSDGIGWAFCHRIGSIGDRFYFVAIDFGWPRDVVTAEERNAFSVELDDPFIDYVRGVAGQLALALEPVDPRIWELASSSTPRGRELAKEKP